MRIRHFIEITVAKESFVYGTDRAARVTNNVPGDYKIRKDEATYFLYDHLGNTRVAFTARDPDSVTIINALDYYSYGKILREYDNGAGDRYLTTGHERDKETGLDYRGARYYDSDVARFLSTDPWQAKYPGWSTYNYVMGNPIKFIDPTGKGPTDVIITGVGSENALKALNESSSLILTRDSQTGKISAAGKATTDADKKLLEAINDKNITVELRTTDKQLIDSKDGTKNIPLTPAAFEGSTVNADKTVSALQIVNVDNAVKIANILGEKTGETLTHEINEAYLGAVQNPGGDYNSAYQQAHNSAAKLDKSGSNHGNLDVNEDRGRNMIQVRKTGTQTWIDLGVKSK